MKSGAVVQLLFTIILFVLSLKPYLLKVQSNGYGILSIFKRNKAVFRQIRHFLFISAIYFVICISLNNLKNDAYFSAIVTVTFFILQGVALTFVKSETLKKPFTATPRAVRLYLFITAVFTVTSVIASVKLTNASGDGATIFIVTLSPLITPIFVFVGNLIITPFEKLNNLRYERAAKKRLSAYPALIKVGVTGSFGKTSVKNILAHMLSVKYRVLATEGNYNTPLGIAKSVASLDEYVDVFIAEMGARKVGDVSRLMNLVTPQIGVLTGVTNQHLETFKTLENVYSEKAKVINMLPSDGYGVTNASTLDVTKLNAPRAERVGIVGTSVYAEGIDVSCNGVTFRLVINGEKYAARTKLLGVHNLQNIITAAAVALYLKVSPKDIVEAIGTLKGVPHRLQLLKNGGVTIIDDTYNGNPVGAAEAIKALSGFSGRRIVVTPGLVELGQDEDAENERLGERLSAVADLVILIGKSRAERIKAGLMRCSYSAEKVKVFSSLQRAEVAFPTLFRGGDTVLFLNDLPDGYDE